MGSSDNPLISGFSEDGPTSEQCIPLPGGDDHLTAAAQRLGRESSHSAPPLVA